MPERQLDHLGGAGRRILAALVDGLLCLANVPPTGPGRVTCSDWRLTRQTDWDGELRSLSSARPPE